MDFKDGFNKFFKINVLTALLIGYFTNNDQPVIVGIIYYSIIILFNTVFQPNLIKICF